jgi:YfiH family protein
VDGGVDRRPVADIIATRNPRVAISVQVADCVPLLLADRRSGAVAAAHAGWRGTAANVAATAVELLTREFGARASDIVVAHGPSIGPCCYTVGREVKEAFRENGFGGWLDRWFREEADGTLKLDLWQANRDQLAAAGVPRHQVHLSELCTFSHPGWFHSYRREGKGTGRIAAVIRARNSQA